MKKYKIMYVVNYAINNDGQLRETTFFDKLKDTRAFVKDLSRRYEIIRREYTALSYGQDRIIKIA